MFTQPTYQSNIRENLNVGSGVINIRANDEYETPPFDQISYKVIGDNKAPTFFQVNPQSGDIKLNVSLETDTDSFYTVGAFSIFLTIQLII